MAGLPRPVTCTDELLLAVHTELVGLRADLRAQRGEESNPDQTGRVQVFEPAPARRPPHKPKD